MNARAFDKQATTGVTGYLTRHGLERGDLRIKALRWGSCEHFRFYHRGVEVAHVVGWPEMLRWLRESDPRDCGDGFKVYKEAL